MPPRKRRAAYLAYNEKGGCHICGRPVRPWSRSCHLHQRRQNTHGHPRAVPLSTHELVRLAAAARGVTDKNRSHPAMTNALEEIADLFAEIADMAERDQSLAPDAELLAHLIKRGLNPYDLIVGASAAALAEHLGRPAVDRQAYLHRITRAVAGMVTGGLRRPNGRPLRATEQRQLGELILSKWDGVLALVVEAVHRQQRKRSDRAAAMNTPLQGDAE